MKPFTATIRSKEPGERGQDKDHVQSQQQQEVQKKTGREGMAWGGTQGAGTQSRVLDSTQSESGPSNQGRAVRGKEGRVGDGRATAKLENPGGPASVGSKSRAQFGDLTVRCLKWKCQEQLMEGQDPGQGRGGGAV